MAYSNNSNNSTPESGLNNSYSAHGIYYDSGSSSIKLRDLVSGDEQVIYSGINNSDLDAFLSSLKTIALSDDLTAVLLQEVSYNSDTGMDEYSFEVLGVNKQGQVTSSSSHHWDYTNIHIELVEVIDESQLLIIGSRDNDEMATRSILWQV